MARGAFSAKHALFEYVNHWCLFWRESWKEGNGCRMKVISNLLFALLLGAIIFTGSVSHLAVGKKKAKDKQTEEADFQEVFKKLDAGARAAMKKDPKEGLKEVERVGRLLIKDYPEEPIPYSMLAFVAGRTGDKEKKVSIFKELAATKSSNPKVAQVVGRAKGELKKMEALGKPLEMKFTAVDGREVDLAKMKGKVVLIDFWATWCGPCIQELPNVKKAYGELHEKGFEIVGISLDKDEKKLTEFVAKNEMPWAQFCDGKGWANTLAKEHGIRSIPAMWLVDKKGNLVDQSARSGLEAKVKKYLAE